MREGYAFVFVCVCTYMCAVKNSPFFSDKKVLNSSRLILRVSLMEGKVSGNVSGTARTEP